ncbi:DUF742 domain-containing protein [Amycolatopsis vastitatis]|uniref:DUF742 domain-containing protein n=1 Tax=Amycolatopsis vastitatis TaxID=1905142 RepID=A0A229T1P1_9PSEU|nr:DUF742 domain-containing protein [Amycolatopsis vastitatis]OXM65092.1 hypothetical protein CF165_24990 [Amycolatopsis vastitatis]
MRISGFDDPDSSGWDALHRGTERESFDSPSKFDMSTLSMIMPKRKPSRPKPDAQGYTDEDTREWGSDAEDDGYDPVEPEWQDEERYEPEPPPLEPAWTPPRGARPPAPPRPVAPRPLAPRPPAPRPPAPRPPLTGPRPQAPLTGPQPQAPLTGPHPQAPLTGPQPQAPSWGPPADWTPPPDPGTRWIPHPEPWEEPAWNEPARVAPVASPGSRVRPYTRTGGRTRSDHNLALEALVSTSDDGRRYRGVRSVEHRRICDLCLDTRSVAEIAAHLQLPLGVVKVLVGDMADIGLVLIHQTELVLGDRSSREFMERVLAGLRAL